MEITQETLDVFKQIVWDYYHKNKRSFLWRETWDPYAIVVSEIMLQQTQTHRVEQTYRQFMDTFPTFDHLACSSLHTVLSAWQGLGYNRRGKYVYQIAQKVVQEYSGILPNTPALLVDFPGIGMATASSICAFAFNKPTIFIETNIRTVFIHMFFNNSVDVHDKELLPLVAATVDQHNPREWYYALMDYGVYLKKLVPNPSRKSKHHTQQSKFQGSDRQIRGAIIRMLVEHTTVSIDFCLNTAFKDDKHRALLIVESLIKEGLVERKNNNICIK